MKRTNVSKVKAVEIDTNAFPDTGWRCAICFGYAQVRGYLEKRVRRY